MNLTNSPLVGTGPNHPLVLGPPSSSRPLHRLAAARSAERVSQGSIARRLHTDLKTVKAQEQETADLPLSTIYQWAEVLEVPVAELLIEPETTISPPLLKRAQAVRLMKTARAIHENARQKSVRWMAQTLVDQLIEMMPELKEIGSWPAVGRRRRRDELGRVAYRVQPSRLQQDSTDE